MWGPAKYLQAMAAGPSADVVVSCRGVTKVYRAPTGPVTALFGVDLDFPSCSLSVIRGASGSGKSSLLRILAGTDRPTSGSAVIAGQEVESLSARRRRAMRRRHVGYVHQEPSHNLLPYLTSAAQLRLWAQMRGAPTGEVDELLEVLGIGSRADHRPDQLSGGEQQRLAFASAVIGRPALVVADEPTAELDSHSAAQLMAAVRDLAARGSTVVVSSHDDVVAAAAGFVVKLDHGSVVASR